MSPQYFLQTYCCLQDRAKTKTVKFEQWPHLINLLNLFLSHRLIIILKARQLGVSTLLCGYSLWKAKFYENTKVLFLSQGEEEAFDLIAKCVFIDNNLPDFLKCPRLPDQRGFIGFPSIGSEIKALPSTEKAGRSTDATIVIPDEFEFHPYDRANYAALKPTIDAGGQLIIPSTADKTKLDTLFKELYRGAMSGSNNFVNVFLDYKQRPGRTEQWYTEIQKDMPLYQVEQEYPATEDEALSTLKARRFFDANALDAMYSNLQGFAPLKHELSDKYKTVKIYRLSQVGRKYCLFNDPSEGRDDPHAIIVIDAITGEQVAESHGKVSADQCALIHDALVRLYNNAFNSWESGPGGAGGIVTNKLKELETPNQCPSLNVSKRPFVLDTKSGKKGWWTSKSLWDVAIWGLEEAVRLHQIIPHSKECLDEFNQFIVPEGEDPQKPRGGHDDYIDAWARVVLLKKYIPTGEFKVYSRDY